MKCRKPSKLDLRWGDPNGIKCRTSSHRGPRSNHGRADHGDNLACRGSETAARSVSGKPADLARRRARDADAKERRRRSKPASHAEISLSYPIVGQELVTGAGERHPAVLEHIGARRQLERHRDVLLHQHAGEALAVEVADRT